jgi:ATP-dependent Clp protease ATP-binding subunit ClpA
VADLQKRLQKKGLGILVTPTAKQYLLDNGYDVHNGVRPLRRLLQDTLEDHLALGLLEDRYTKGDVVKVSAKHDELIYETVREVATATT